MSDPLYTPLFRASFVNVFKPRKNQRDEDRYSVTMLFPPDTDLSALKAAAEACAREQWGDKVPKNLRSPFLDAGDFDYEGCEEGWTMIRTTSTRKPDVVSTKADPETGKPMAVTDPDEFYSGCWAIATVNAFAYGDKPEHSGNKGISFGLRNIQVRRQDEPLGGTARKGEDDFQATETATPPAGKKADTSSIFG